MTEYLSLTLLADSGESEAAFKARLAAFWTHMIRNKPDDYEKVFAEATKFGSEDGRISRQYMVEAAAIRRHPVRGFGQPDRTFAR